MGQIIGVDFVVKPYKQEKTTKYYFDTTLITKKTNITKNPIKSEALPFFEKYKLAYTYQTIRLILIKHNLWTLQQ